MANLIDDHLVWLLISATLASFLLAAPTAHAGSDKAGWQESFPASSLPTALTDRKLLVTASGDQLSEARSAARALRRALNNAGTPLVMDASSLRDVADLDDQKIVDQAADLPVEGIVIVRVFAGSEAPNAVVSAYDPEGEAIAGFSVQKGEKLQAGDSNQAARGISQKTVESIDSATSSDDETSPERASDRYEISTSMKWELFDRKVGKTFSGADIYQRLDRPKLADQFEKNLRSRKTFRWIGVGTTVAGLAVAGIALLTPDNSGPSDSDDLKVTDNNEMSGDNRDSSSQSYPECQNRDFESVAQNCRAEKQQQESKMSDSSSSDTSSSPSSTGESSPNLPVAAIASGATVLVGATITTLTLVGNPHPVSETKLESIADEHDPSPDKNEKREKQEARRPAPQIGWSVTPTKGGVQGFVEIRW